MHYTFVLNNKIVHWPLLSNPNTNCQIPTKQKRVKIWIQIWIQNRNTNQKIIKEKKKKGLTWISPERSSPTTGPAGVHPRGPSSSPTPAHVTLRVDIDEKTSSSSSPSLDAREVDTAMNWATSRPPLWTARPSTTALDPINTRPKPPSLVFFLFPQFRKP